MHVDRVAQPEVHLQSLVSPQHRQLDLAAGRALRHRLEERAHRRDLVSIQGLHQIPILQPHAVSRPVPDNFMQKGSRSPDRQPELLPFPGRHVRRPGADGRRHAGQLRSGRRLGGPRESGRTRRRTAETEER